MTEKIQQLLIIGLGGFFGAISRYSITIWVQKKFPNFQPAGTLVVNVAGCLLIGFLMGCIAQKTWLTDSPRAKLLLITGFLGSLTTFSTFGYETVQFLQLQEVRSALMNVTLNLVLGIIAVFAGYYFANPFSGS